MIRGFPELRRLPVELVRGRTLLVAEEEEGGDPAAALPSVRHGHKMCACITRRSRQIPSRFCYSPPPPHIAPYRTTQALLCGEYVVPGVHADRPGARRVLRCGATREYVREPWSRRPEEEPQQAHTQAQAGPEAALLDALRQKAEALHPGLVGAPAAYGVTTGTRVGTKRR